MNDADFLWVQPPEPNEEREYREWDGSYVTGMAEGEYEIPAPDDEPSVGLAVTLAAAASLLDMSTEDFDEAVKPFLRVVGVSGRTVVPIRELERWLEWSAAELM